MHEDRLPQCEVFQADIAKKVDKHVEESGPVRLDVQRHDNQIVTLEKAHEETMKDIREIKDDLKKVRDNIWAIKVWILSAAVAGLMVLLGEALYFGGYIKQADMDSQRILSLEEMHPRNNN